MHARMSLKIQLIVVSLIFLRKFSKILSFVALHVITYFFYISIRWYFAYYIVWLAIKCWLRNLDQPARYFDQHARYLDQRARYFDQESVRSVSTWVHYSLTTLDPSTILSTSSQYYAHMNYATHGAHTRLKSRLHTYYTVKRNVLISVSMYEHMHTCERFLRRCLERVLPRAEVSCQCCSGGCGRRWCAGLS